MRAQRLTIVYPASCLAVSMPTPMYRHPWHAPCLCHHLFKSEKKGKTKGRSKREMWRKSSGPLPGPFCRALLLRPFGNLFEHHVVSSSRRSLRLIVTVFELLCLHGEYKEIKEGKRNARRKRKFGTSRAVQRLETRRDETPFGIFCIRWRAPVEQPLLHKKTHSQHIKCQKKGGN